MALFNLASVAVHRSEFRTALSLFEQSLTLRREIGDRRSCAYVQVSLSWVEHQRGNHDRAAVILREALVVLRELNDRQLIAWALSFRGLVAHDMGEFDRARILLEESLSVAQEVGNKVIIAWALTQLADVLHSQDKVDLALPLLEEGISLWRAVNRWGLPPALYCRGSIALRLRDFERASALYCESLELWSKMGTRGGIADCLEGFAGLALARGDPAGAARLYATAESIRQAIDAPRPPRRRAEHEHNLATLRRELGEERFATAWAEGRAMTPEQACEQAG